MAARHSILGALRRFSTRGRDPGAASIEAQMAALEAFGIFDREAYLRENADVAAAGGDALRHYITNGASEGRRPCALFDGAYYLANNRDVAREGSNPLLHYLQFGWREGRNPSAEFDGAWYTATHLASLATPVNPLVHYLTRGRAEGLAIRAVTDTAYAEIAASGLFDAGYYRERYPDIAETGIDPLRHYLRHGAREGRNPSLYFDSAYYLRNNPSVARRRVNPLLHFCRHGWKELRNPNPDFDVWWYWSNHLDPASEDVNPLAHYVAIGREAGLATRPDGRIAQLANAGWTLPGERRPRRIVLFAGYDPDGIVDDYVVDYLRELARHADVHYLADCEMQACELDKLEGIVASASAERHGEYDFGSYSRLARRVGWDAIEQYDELILANDSCYLLRTLDHVFEEMDARACDWWGMQATKGIYATRSNPRNRFLQPIPMSTVRLSMLAEFERDYCYDFHVGSYFVAYRQPVIRDVQFRRLLDSVVAQEHKRNLILKYEVGITRSLVARGFAMDTFVNNLYPFHPTYTRWHFRLLDEGFPFLKRYLLSENHYRVPGLHAWKEIVQRKVPDARLEPIESNLARIVEPEKLQANLHVGSTRIAVDGPVPRRLLGAADFLAADQASPKYGHWWGFPACAFTRRFSGNERAIFEQVRYDPEIRKIIFTRGAPVRLDGENVEIVRLESPLGQHRLMRCGQLFVKHSPTRNLVHPVAPELHNIINVWHGIPFKRIGYTSLDMRGRLQAIAHEHAKCKAVISASAVDTMAMASSFYPLSYNDIWPTGLPRNDFILREFERLPEDLRAEEEALRAQLEGRRLVLFAPTFRNGQEESYYRFGEDEVEWLRAWLLRNNAVLGLREHMADKARTYTTMLAGLQPLDLSDAQYPNIEVLYRCSSALVTDYSSCFIDYMLTGKPAASFAYDYDTYSNIERGAFYDLEFVFPGPVCRDFDQISQALDRMFDVPDERQAALLEWKRRLFFDHVDDGSSARFVDRVKQLMDFGDIGINTPAIGI